MANVIAFTRADGGTSVVHPHNGARLVRNALIDGHRVNYDPPIRLDEIHRRWTPEIEAALAPEWAETDDEFLERVARKAIPDDAADVIVIDKRQIPADRTFREAWSVTGGAVAVDMGKARTIHMDRIRAARAPALAALDVQYQIADETGDVATKRAIAAEKKALRDIPQTFDLTKAETAEQLAVLWPEGLAKASPVDVAGSVVEGTAIR